MSRNVRLTRIIRETGDVAYGLSNLNFQDFHSPEGWTPDINVYRYSDRFEVWVDLGGVRKEDICVDVLSEKLRISGLRQPPTPTRDASSQCQQVMSLEIRNGRFSREIHLSREVDRDRVSARQENGLLWVVLPFAQSDETEQD
ncbi:MAG: Hsp20/alpha crystallin family protein [Verrucomicrobiales bacterium]|nr:Hsp20/alpha crystallin family protein [Verrucomicrobiales bacterium]